MEEKVYKSMNGAGALNIVLGVIGIGRSRRWSTSDYQRCKTAGK